MLPPGVRRVVAVFRGTNALGLQGSLEGISGKKLSQSSKRLLERGGKRSATPLWTGGPIQDPFQNETIGRESSGSYGQFAL
jgi:hypothetical protein